MKVSFDFDNTLTEKPIQILAKKFIKLGAEVFIVTSRTTEVLGQKIPNADVFQIASDIGIKKENIIFTSYIDKYEFVKDMDIHFDDNFEEIFLINQHQSKCIGFLYEDKPNDGTVNF